MNKKRDNLLVFVLNIDQGCLFNIRNATNRYSTLGRKRLGFFLMIFLMIFRMSFFYLIV